MAGAPSGSAAVGYRRLWADLSFILPMTGVGYILAAVLGAWLLKEPVSAARWMGVLLIFAGTSLVAATSQKTESHE